MKIGISFTPRIHNNVDFKKIASYMESSGYTLDEHFEYGSYFSKKRVMSVLLILEN